MFDKQLALHDDPGQFKECHAGRRGGKSDGMPKSACLDGLDAGLNEVVLIGAETLKKARALHWANLNAVVKQFDLPFVPNGSDACWTNPRGGRIQFWGLNDTSAVEELRGFKLLSAKFDESATLAPMLPRLVTDVLEPALGDLGGQLTLYGTPSVTRAGPWFDICEGKDATRWAHHHWDARDNPHFRRGRGGAAAWFEEVLQRNGWTWTNPTFEREYLGLFRDDHTRRVVEYDAVKHLLKALPPDYGPHWYHVAGADYGFNDAFAVVVIAVDPYTLTKYVVWAEKHSGKTYDDCADILHRVVKAYPVQKIACDPAGGGKPFYETFNRRYARELGAVVTSAHKSAGSVVESIRFQNTELRCGRMFLGPDAVELGAEWQVLPWKDEYRDEVHEGFPQDMFDGCRYALIETMPLVAKSRPAQESEAERLERVLREQTESHFRREQDTLSRLQERY